MISDRGTFPHSMKRIVLFVILIVTFMMAQTDIYHDEKLLEEIKQRYGKFAYNRVKSYLETVHSLKYATESKKLKRMNVFLNWLVSEKDSVIWKQEDYWASREEFLLRGRGDCEDYVIAKYFTFRDLGIDNDKLYLAVVYNKYNREDHAVLLYYPDQKALPVVLDNINPKLLPLNQRNDLELKYVFNSEGLREFESNGRLKPGDVTGGKKLYGSFVEVQKRMKQNRFFPRNY